MTEEKDSSKEDKEVQQEPSVISDEAMSLEELKKSLNKQTGALMALATE